MSEPLIFHVKHDCGAAVVVVPSELLGVIGSVSGAPEAELAVMEQVPGLSDADGRQFVIADVEGVFTCPACQAPGRVPK